jgi:hypothetical protein
MTPRPRQVQACKDHAWWPSKVWSAPVQHAAVDDRILNALA